MQVAIAIDQPAPFLAKSFFSNPTGEGWALYAEALAAEMGLYADDPVGETPGPARASGLLRHGTSLRHRPTCEVGA